MEKASRLSVRTGDHSVECHVTALQLAVKNGEGWYGSSEDEAAAKGEQ